MVCLKGKDYPHFCGEGQPEWEYGMYNYTEGRQDLAWGSIEDGVKNLQLKEVVGNFTTIPS